ncbi:hypothetical protein LEN26_016700 [Aphanomyces euteiches]|nr:hypothetical protein LEN26_016700 [Aphanomyces euteiches]
MSTEPTTPTSGYEAPSKDKPEAMNLFSKYLSVWVFAAMVVGVLLGYYVPSIPTALDKATVSGISIPIAVFLWGMILPMMLSIDFSTLVAIVQAPKPILLCSIVNYAIQPFTMYGIALLFFRNIYDIEDTKANGYIVGSILLGGAPCTAMVFVWSKLMRGNASYTLAQVAFNNVLLLVLYVPTAKLLAGASDIVMPWDTLFASVGLFIVVPLVIAVVTRRCVSETTLAWIDQRLLPLLDTCSMVFLILMIVLIFISQADTITHNWVDILLIAVPLILQTALIWGIMYAAAIFFRLPYEVAGPATLIACSNFFEMAVAVAASVYGSGSPATLATVVGVLIEVPVMLILVGINNKTQHFFTKAQEVSLQLDRV